MQQRKAPLFIWVLYWIFLVGSFLVIGFLLIARATGYRFNPHTHGWQKTGMIYVTVDPRESTLTLDGTDYPVGQNTRIPNVLPGNYRITIKKPGFSPWNETISVQPGYVISLNNITLYSSHPVEVPVTDAITTLVNSPVPDHRISLRDGELWFGTQLVSRFSEAPTSAALLPTLRNIVYLRGNQIRIIEVDGQNDTLLYTRSSNEASPIVALNDSIIAFMDGGIIKALQIR